MKQFFLAIGFCFFCSTFCLPSIGQNISKLPTYKVGIFAPLYLDSVFSNGSFKFNKGIPKFINPALEFVQGALVALDSMQTPTYNIIATVFDTKSYSQNIGTLIKINKLDSLDLIIGSVKDIDYKQLADFALAKKIPFVSATYPNDGGVVSNPFTIIANPTLKAHCESIYSFILQNHSTDKIFLARKKGVQEDKIANYFKAMNEQDGKPLLNIQTIYFDSAMDENFLQNKLDSNRQTILIGASLDENFANNIAKASYDLYESYRILLMGMPNWDGFAGLRKKGNFEAFPIYYTSPYFNNKWDAFSKMLANVYAKKYKTKPTDMAFKGFEYTYFFTKILGAYPTTFMDHINDKTFKVFCDYNFRPVNLKKDNKVADYIENKHLYFIKLLNGVTTKAVL
jgi:hypothetical protein